MRIGIDGGCLANQRGFGRFARQTLAALAEANSPHRFVVFVDRPSVESVRVPDGFETVVVDVRDAPSRAASAQGSRRVSDLLAMGRAVARTPLDLMFFPASYSFFPVWNCGRLVVTMHDTLALAHPDLVFPTRRGRIAWTLKEYAAARWADRILTVSQTARRDLIAWFNLPESRVDVVGEGPEAVFRPTPLGAESDAVLTRYGLSPKGRYWLYVGGLSPHKNLLRLIEAFSRTEADDLTLVLVGDLGDVFHTHVPALRDATKRWNVKDRVIFTGFVPDDELATLYSRAYALVQPSLMEGFGLPPVESMACGTPVLYSRAGSLPEVVGAAGLDFDPTDVRAMTSILDRVASDLALRQRLAGLALERAKEHTWAASAQALLACFESLRPGRTRGAVA
ncbi:MAG: glycosyltransferase family 1 protein [Isosphaeraceae bacterium]